MTGKEIVNLIRQLRSSGMSDSKILDFLAYIETHDPKQQPESTDKSRPHRPYTVTKEIPPEPPGAFLLYFSRFFSLRAPSDPAPR